MTSGMIGMRRCLECGCKVQMSPDVVLECQECGRGSADSCITTGHWSYIYYRVSREIASEAHSRSFILHSHRSTMGGISSYDIAGLISEVSEEVATEIAKTCAHIPFLFLIYHYTCN